MYWLELLGEADILNAEPFTELINEANELTAICRKIVALHGGQIRPEGSPGKGATFTVTLPIRPSPRRPIQDAARVSIFQRSGAFC